MSTELVVDITEYALNKPGFVNAAMDMACAPLVTVLPLVGALDRQTMLNRSFFLNDLSSLTPYQTFHPQSAPANSYSLLFYLVPTYASFPELEQTFSNS